MSDATDDSVARARAIGAGIGMLIVALTYEASRYGDPDRWWAAAAIVLVGVLLADGLADIRALLPTPGCAPLTIVAVLVAVVGCVPETDQLPIVAVVPVALVLLEVASRRQMPIEWYVVAAAAVGWGAMFGATGRQSALVGALFAWWAVLLPGFIHAARTIRSQQQAGIVAVVAAGAAVAMSRTGGIATTWPAVAFGAIGFAGLSILISWAVVDSTGQQAESAK